MSRTRWKKSAAAVAAAMLFAAGIVYRDGLAGWFLGRGADVHSDAAHYTCSMDPSVRADGPGQCPICGMTLTPVSRQERATDTVHVSLDSMRRIGVRFAAAEEKTLTKIMIGLGEVVAVEPAAGAAPARVVAQVHDADPGAVKVGQLLWASFSALPVTQFRATVVESRFDAEDRSLWLTAMVENPDRVLEQGMHAEVQIEVDLPERLVVPAEAVVHAGPTRLAFVDKGRGYFEPRRLEIGAQFAGQVEVRKGLSAGERVVVSGNFLIAAESRIRSASTLWTEGAAKKPAPKRPAEPNRPPPKKQPDGAQVAPPAQAAPAADAAGKATKPPVEPARRSAP